MFAFVFCLKSFACMHSVPLLYACPSGYTIQRSDRRSDDHGEVCHYAKEDSFINKLIEDLSCCD